MGSAFAASPAVVFCGSAFERGNERHNALADRSCVGVHDRLIGDLQTLKVAPWQR